MANTPTTEQLLRYLEDEMGIEMRRLEKLMQEGRQEVSTFDTFSRLERLRHIAQQALAKGGDA